MKAIGFAFFCLSAFAGQVYACGCYSYPFEPSPPCYKTCTEMFVENGGKDLGKIKDLPPSVRDDLRILVDKKNRFQKIDFDNIQGPSDLSKAARINGSRTSPLLNDRIQLQKSPQLERSRTLSAPMQ